MEKIKKGFTLVELLVVIVIIGILATIGIATFSGYFAKARDVERKTNVSQARSVFLAQTTGEDVVNYAADYADATTVNAELAKADLVLTANGDYEYYFAATANDFAFGVCFEEEGASPPGLVSGTDKTLIDINLCAPAATVPAKSTDAVAGFSLTP